MKTPRFTVFSSKCPARSHILHGAIRIASSQNQYVRCQKTATNLFSWASRRTTSDKLGACRPKIKVKEVADLKTWAKEMMTDSKVQEEEKDIELPKFCAIGQAKE